MTDQLNPEDRALIERVYGGFADCGNFSSRQLSAIIQAARTEGRQTNPFDQPCYECGSTEILGPICAKCNPGLADQVEGRRSGEGGDAAKFVENWFSPWGSWKTAWWEGEVSDDVEMTDANALIHLRKLLSAPPVEAKPAEGIETGERWMIVAITSAGEDVVLNHNGLEDFVDGLCGEDSGLQVPNGLGAGVFLVADCKVYGNPDEEEREPVTIEGTWIKIGGIYPPYVPARDEAALPEPVAWRYRWMDAAYGEFADWDVAPSRDAAVALAGKQGEVAPLYTHSATGTDELPADVVRLVIAARKVAFEDTVVAADLDGAAALKALDEASEAFADRVAWEDEPEEAALAPFADRVPGEADQ